MSTRASKWFISMATVIALTGCGQPQLSGDQSFNVSTGLSLPPGTDCLAAKTITVAFLDTYYLKLQTTNNIAPFLAAHFHLVSWDAVKDDMMPPPDWKKDLPFWNQAEIEQQVHYSGDYTDKSGSRFKVALSYDTNHMTVYFVGMQCRD